MPREAAQRDLEIQEASRARPGERTLPKALAALRLPVVFRFEDDEDADSPVIDPLPERTCADCGRPAPRTRTAHTLISAQHGWRLQRDPRGAGRVSLEWRCPKCWAARKNVLGT